ncbi:hypothetical protein AB9F34_34495, partial [Rhizobium leguminosarum]
AGLRQGDIISEIRDEEVDCLADFYRKICSSGPAGAEIPMRILRNGREAWLRGKFLPGDDICLNEFSDAIGQQDGIAGLG